LELFYHVVYDGSIHFVVYGRVLVSRLGKLVYYRWSVAIGVSLSGVQVIMPATRVGCLKAHDCICDGKETIPPIGTHPVDYITKRIPCPGPTEAQYGHIKKARQKVVNEQKTRAEKFAALANYYASQSTEETLSQWNDAKNAGYAIASLAERVRELEKGKAILEAWLNKQGHDKCWYYPEVFAQLAKVYGIPCVLTPPVTISREEFEQGCHQFQDRLFPLE
jgi:hypothetical protein